MELLRQMYNTENPNILIKNILESEILLKFGQEPIEDRNKIKIALEKINSILTETIPKSKLLLRGITKSVIKNRLISKLNSNDSLYDGLFLVGDKAKNFLEKPENIPHPIQNISSTTPKASSWIFTKYSEMDIGPIDLNYFKNSKNKRKFNIILKGNHELFDYYLFGLHTKNSDNLVNFISTTTSPKVVLHNSTSNKLIIFLWLPYKYQHYIDFKKLNDFKEIIQKKGLPILKDSFYPNEMEISFKGFIPPHIILGVHDIDENALILNPALLNHQHDWMENGLNINQVNFEIFIKQTKYKRFLILTDKLTEINL